MYEEKKHEKVFVNFSRVFIQSKIDEKKNSCEIVGKINEYLGWIQTEKTVQKVQFSFPYCYI